MNTRSATERKFSKFSGYYSLGTDNLLLCGSGERPCYESQIFSVVTLCTKPLQSQGSHRDFSQSSQPCIGSCVQSLSMHIYDVVAVTCVAKQALLPNIKIITTWEQSSGKMNAPVTLLNEVSRLLSRCIRLTETRQPARSGMLALRLRGRQVMALAVRSIRRQN